MRINWSQPRIRTYLTALVLCCLAPVCLGAAFLVNYSYRDRMSLLDQNLLATANVLSTALDRDLEIAQRSLEALATSPAIASGDFGAFHQQALSVLQAFPGSDIIMADETGQQVINSYKPFGSALPKRGPGNTVRNIFETGQPAISNVFKGAVTGRYLIGVDVPVFLDGRVRYDLAMTLPADSLLTLLRMNDLPREWLITILDGDRTIVARSRAPNAYIGKKIISPPLLSLMAEAHHGGTEGLNMEGTLSRVSFEYSERTGWTVLVSAPKALMARQLRNWLLWVVAGLTTLLVLGFALAMKFTRTITRSVQSLVPPALALGRGEDVPLGDFELKETGEVANALIRASALLQETRVSRDELIREVEERGRAEENLRAAMQRFHNILSNIFSGILVLNQEEKVEFANPIFCEQFDIAESPSDLIGLKADELIQMVLAAYAAPDASLTRIREILSAGLRVEGEEIPLNNGRVLLRDYLPILVDGEPRGRMWQHRDITERKHLEERLREMLDEMDLRVRERTGELVEANRALKEKAEIIDLAHDAIFVRDSESRITFWSKGAQATYGFTPEEALGRVSDELLKTVFPTPCEEIASVVFRDGEWTGELRHRKADGEEIIVDSRWAAHIDAAGQMPGFLEVNRDITCRKLTEAALLKVDRAFRTLSECNQVMVRQTEEMDLLRQICRILVDGGGYRMAWVGFAENDERKTVRPVASAGYDHGYLENAEITWSDSEKGRGPTGTAIRTGKITISQNALLNPAYRPWILEGMKRGYAASISMPLIVERQIIGALTIHASEQDAFDEAESDLLSSLAENLAFGISSIRLAEHRRQAQEDLRVYASRLEVINNELREFAFVASHDLQEPLRKIQTFCDLATSRCAPALDVRGREYLERVTSSASRMRQLLEDLLAFSRVASRPEPFTKLKLGKLAKEAADIFEAAVMETGCRIEIEELPVIEADESQILRLFQNLIGNALKYRGGESPFVRIYGRVGDQGKCELCVEDNGIGFDQEFAELIFRPFQRLHGRKEYDGTGMGLAICRKIVERHSGTIRAESAPGKGSRFIVHLPVKQSPLDSIIAGER